MLRGFGFVFKVGAGTTRSWYAGQDGVRRWTDNDQPMDTPAPDRPVPMGDDE